MSLPYRAAPAPAPTKSLSDDARVWFDKLTTNGTKPLALSSDRGSRVLTSSDLSKGQGRVYRTGSRHLAYAPAALEFKPE